MDQVWKLEGEKVIVECDSDGRPIMHGGGIFSGVLGRLARDIIKFLIDYYNWFAILDSVKDGCLDNMVMVIMFLFYFL